MLLLLDIIVFGFLILWREVDGRKFIILSNRYGNIGNQLYMTCFLIHWAKKYKALTFNFGLIGNDVYFENTKNNLFLNYPTKKWILKFKNLKRFLSDSIDRISLRLINFQKIINSFGIDLIEIKPDSKCCDIERRILKTKILFLRDFIHEVPYSYFGGSFNDISTYLSPASCYQNSIDQPIHYLSACDIKIGVIIRHGDYRKWKNGEFFLKTKVYQKWMVEAEKLFSPKKVGFFIASDEQQDLSIFQKNIFYFRCGHAISNLYSLAKCDYLMTVPSSFSGWAHFIGKVPCLVLDRRIRTINLNDFKNWNQK